MSWLCEDNPQIQSDGNTVIVSDGDYFKKCVPLTALFKPASGGQEIGKSYWEFRFSLDECDAYVGFTTEKLFGPGYRSKALLYGGNLSSGSTHLVPDFGEHIRDEDTVGLLLDTDESSLKMYVYHNQQPLGLAFHLAKPYPKPLFPVVHFFGPGKVTIQEMETLPTRLERVPMTFEGIEGCWHIDKCETNGQVIPESAKWKKYTMEIFMDGARKYRRSFGSKPLCPSSRNARPYHQKKPTYSLRFRLINSIFARLEEQGSNQWSLVPGSATLLGVSGENAQIENFITDFLGKFENLFVEKIDEEEEAEEQLVMLADDESRIYLKRFNKESPAPVTINPLSKPD